MPNIDRINKYKNIHMIGIGGVSMSGIAAILTNFGFHVTGSDSNESETIPRLREKGINVEIGSNLSDLKKSDVVVYSAAIKKDNTEMLEAKKLNIPTIERADFLGELTRCYENTICVSGTHGKTTTTSMLSLCFIEGLKDPTIQVGAYLKQIDGNFLVGNSENFIIEACEYVESFLKFNPKTEIILNIDNDHLDYFKNFDNIKKSFKKYINLLPENGLLVLNFDDKSCLELSKNSNCKVVSCGINNSSADFVAKNIIFDDDGFSTFDVFYKNEFFDSFKLSVPGIHNVYNALACICVSNTHSINNIDIKSALSKFTGAHRRFEFKGKINTTVSVYDDYAHHPTEIDATYNSLSNKKYTKSWAIFQPHTYSRTSNLLDAFANSLKNFDNIILLDIYAARENNTYNISTLDLYNKLKELNINTYYIPDFNDCINFVKSNVNNNDIVLTIGAGTVTNIGSMLIN